MPELTPSVPADNASVIEANRHAMPARSGRRSGSTPPSSSIQPPAKIASGASTRAPPSSQPSATLKPWPARPPSQPPYRTKPRKTPAATSARPSTSRPAGERLKRSRPATAARTRVVQPISSCPGPRRRARARGLRRRRVEPRVDRRAGALFPVRATWRNFDAEPAEPPTAPYHRFSADRYTNSDERLLPRPARPDRRG